MEDQEYFDYILDDMRIEGPYGFEEAKDIYSIIKGLWWGPRGRG